MEVINMKSQKTNISIQVFLCLLILGTNTIFGQQIDFDPDKAFTKGSEDVQLENYMAERQGFSYPCSRNPL
jgi:hypothetical protein